MIDENTRRELEKFLTDTELHSSLQTSLVTDSVDMDRVLKLIQTLTSQDSFFVTICRYLNEQDYRDADFYTDANIGPATWHNMQAVNYRASKDTVFKCILTLRLDYTDGSALLEKAGYAFVWTTKKDLIIIFCVIKRIHDRVDIDTLLYENGVATLFS